MYKKVMTIMLFVSFSFMTLGIDKTNAYFSDTESSTGNTFTAGSLDISFNNTADYSTGPMYPNDATTTAISISNIGSLDSQYTASTTLVGADTSACDYVTMTATSPATTLYSGLIRDFMSVPVPTADTVWNYNFTVSPSAPSSVWSKTCSFKWVYTAWQDNFPDPSSGFYSVKEKLGEINIGKAVVMNEVLADPDTGSSAPADREFIELYNNSTISINLADWQVSEMSSSGEQKYTITTATTGSYRAVPYGGSTIISPKSWVTLLFSGSVLNNDGDIVRLYDLGGINKLDEFSYPMNGEGPKPKGNSYARIPDGIGNWVDPIPTPGWTNNFSEIFETILGTTTEEPIATSTPEIATSTSQSGGIAVEQATSTAGVAAETATTTTEQIVSTEQITTAIATNETATTTPEVTGEPTSTSTPEMITEEPVVTEITPPARQDGESGGPDPLLSQEGELGIPSPDQGEGQGGVLSSEPVAESEPIIEPPPTVELPPMDSTNSPQAE